MTANTGVPGGSGFEIALADAGEVHLVGRLDAAHCEIARDFFAGMFAGVFAGVDGPRVMDFARLEFISSAGLGVLLMVQKRVMQTGGAITLVNVNENIRNVFRHSGFDRLFQILDART